MFGFEVSDVVDEVDGLRRIVFSVVVISLSVIESWTFSSVDISFARVPGVPIKRHAR